MNTFRKRIENFMLPFLLHIHFNIKNQKKFHNRITNNIYMYIYIILDT